MAKDDKKSKAPKGKKAYQQGYISFTPEDLQEHAKSDPANSEAYGLLDKAMTTSSHITVEDKSRFENGGTVDIDDVYPVSLEETLEMEQLLDEAERRAGNPDEPFFRERLDELRGIIGWSKERHWNFSWLIILGVCITVCYFFYRAGDAHSKASSVEYEVEMVKSWEKNDTTLVLADLKDGNGNSGNMSLSGGANQFKALMLQSVAETYYYSMDKEAEYTAKADTATIKTQKEEYLAKAEDYKKRSDEALEKFNKINGMKFKEFRKMVLSQIKGDLFFANLSKRFAWGIFFFFFLLIPLYIYADRPYGWMESRHRTEAKVLGGIRKWAFAIAGVLAGSALAMNYAPDTVVKTKWSDGSTSTHTESNPLNILILGMKICMYIAAVIILAVVSTVIMIYSTVQGLRRNYDWTPVKLKLKEMFGKAKGNIEASVKK